MRIRKLQIARFRQKIAGTLQFARSRNDVLLAPGRPKSAGRLVFPEEKYFQPARQAGKLFFTFDYTGRNWLGHDLQHRRTGARVEVKQSARRQPWSTTRPSPLRFDIAPRTGHYADDGITWVPRPGRAADIYIFALHEGWQPADAVDHRDPAQWRFLVLPASALPDGQKTIAPSSLRALGAHSADMHTLAATVEPLLPRP